MTIQLEVQDEFIKQVGKDALLQKMYIYLEWEKLRLLAQEIQQALEEVSLESDHLWQEARKQAWESYKVQQLPFLAAL